MYSNMSQEDSFKQYVVDDGRSYSNETFEKAINILNSTKKNIIIDMAHQQAFETLAAELKVMKNSAMEEDVSFVKFKLTFY